MNTDLSYPSPKRISPPRRVKTSAARPTAPAMAIDPVLTRVAVDLTMPKNHVSSLAVKPHLDALRKLMSLDCVFVALFGSNGRRIEWVATSDTRYEHCSPAELVGGRQPCNGELLTRLARHQLLDIRDSAVQQGEYAEFCNGLVQLNLCSMLVGGIVLNDTVTGLLVFGSLHRRPVWEMEMHLAMKLAAASYSAGYERYQLGVAG